MYDLQVEMIIWSTSLGVFNYLICLDYFMVCSALANLHKCSSMNGGEYER